MKRIRSDTSTPSDGDRESRSATGQRILFTGPDGIGDFRPKLDYFPRSIGIGPLPPDATSDLNYLFRSAPCAPPPLPKHCYTGAVGWGLRRFSAFNRLTNSNNKTYECDRCDSAARDGSTLSPRQTEPHFLDKQPVNHSSHEDHNKHK